MKVFYLLFLSVLFIEPVYAEDDILSVSETAEENAENMNVAVDTTEEKIDLLQTTESAEEAGETTENVNEKIDLLQATESTEDVKDEEKKSEPLPDSFKNSLHTCTPDLTVRTVDTQQERIEIIGIDSEYCKVRLAVFNLNIPMPDLIQIETYDDLEKLCKNPEISTLMYTENYNYTYLMSELNQCKNYKFSHHNGRATAEYAYVGVTSVTDMTAQHKEGVCELTFVNEITVDDKFMNYTVVCEIPDEKIDTLMEPYRDLADLYGAKEIVNSDGSTSSRTAVSNNETQHADGKLMYELQTAGYCRLSEPKE